MAHVLLVAQRVSIGAMHRCISCSPNTARQFYNKKWAGIVIQALFEVPVLRIVM